MKRVVNSNYKSMSLESRLKKIDKMQSQLRKGEKKVFGTMSLLPNFIIGSKFMRKSMILDRKPCD